MGLIPILNIYRLFVSLLLIDLSIFTRTFTFVIATNSSIELSNVTSNTTMLYIDNSLEEQKTIITATILGSIASIIIIFGTIKYCWTKKEMEMRRNRTKLSAKYALEADRTYGIQRTPSNTSHIDAVVIYSLKNPQNGLISKNRSSV
jgi:hypothetical protein